MLFALFFLFSLSAAFGRLEPVTPQTYVTGVLDRVLIAGRAAGCVWGSNELSAHIKTDNDKVNAESSITINRGLLFFLQDEDELAGVLAHELAHRCESEIRDSEFSTSSERESWADEFGTYLVWLAGYHTDALPGIFERLERREDLKLERSNSNDPDWKPSHPPLSERVARLRKFISNRHWKSTEPRQSEPYRTSILKLYRPLSDEKSKFGSVIDPGLRVDLVRLQQLREYLKYAEYEDRKERLKRWEQAGQMLSGILKRYPELQIRIMRSSELRRDPGETFLGELLYQPFPAWLTEPQLLYAAHVQTIQWWSRLGASLVPGVGDSIDFYELWSGKDFLSGESLTSEQRTFAAFGVLLGTRQAWNGASEVSNRALEAMPEMSGDAKIALKSALGLADGSKIVSSETVNQELMAHYSSPPFLSASNVISRTSNEGESFVRFITSENQARGQWIVRKSEVAGLTAEEVAEKLALQTTPTKIVDVILPEGTPLFEGLAGSNFERNGMGWQVYIRKKEPDPSWFTNERPFQ